MIENIKKYLLRLVMNTVLLIILGLVIWYAARSSALTFKDTLFWVGAVPIALFSISIFGSFGGRGDPEAQFSKSVLKKSPNQRSVDDQNDISRSTSSSLGWLLAGLLVWLFSYFI